MEDRQLTDQHKPTLNATFETGIYIILFIVALGFRFGALGASGLSDLEATHALQALGYPGELEQLLVVNPDM